ncbi:MAG TPA: CBS domain-containing protein [Streptosporangiaceae bacterium]|nr:CBS domain-containing protein [Streptosporangiaceae bacterium]
MTRQDVHLDAMLRHLGAAYYDSLHDRAAPDDVDRAVDQVATKLGERPAGGHQQPPPPAGQTQRHPPRHHGRWHSRVRDIMSTSVVTVDRITPYKEIAQLLVEHQISGVPVLILGRHVAGVVSEADLIAARDKDVATRRMWSGVLRYGTDHSRHIRLTAENLMTAPAVTIYPEATIAAAARCMTSHHVRRLPVTDSDGKLVGLVSRRDLLGIFIVPDAEIERQVRELFAEVAPAEEIKVHVQGGIVTLTGHVSRTALHGAIRTAVDLAWDIDGVVDVIEHTESAA